MAGKGKCRASWSTTSYGERSIILRPIITVVGIAIKVIRLKTTAE